MIDYDSDIEPSELHALAVKSAKARGVDVDNWDAIRDDFDKGWEAFLQMYFAVRYFARYHSDLGYLDDEPTCQWWLIAKLNDDLLAQSMILFDSADEMRCTMEGMHENPVKYIEEHYKATDGNRSSTPDLQEGVLELGGKTKQRRPRLEVSGTMQQFIYDNWGEFNKGNATIEVNGKPRKAGGKRNYAEFLNLYGAKQLKGDGKTIREAVGGDIKNLSKIIHNCKRRKA